MSFTKGVYTMKTYDLRNFYLSKVFIRSLGSIKKLEKGGGTDRHSPP